MTDEQTRIENLNLPTALSVFVKSRLCKCAKRRNFNSPYLHGLTLTIKCTHSIAKRFKKNNSVKVHYKTAFSDCTRRPSTLSKLISKLNELSAPSTLQAVKNVLLLIHNMLFNKSQQVINSFPGSLPEKQSSAQRAVCRSMTI